MRELNIFDDNKNSLILTKKLGSQNHKKYINTIYYYIYRLVEYEKLLIK